LELDPVFLNKFLVKNEKNKERPTLYFGQLLSLKPETILGIGCRPIQVKDKKKQKKKNLN